MTAKNGLHNMAQVIQEIERVEQSATDFALFSGGNDSVVSTHKAHSEYDIDYTVYLDTNTGLQENKDHVKETCDKFGWDLLIAQSPMTLKEFALGSETREPLGFPSPSMHSWAYRYFKERQIAAIASHVNDNPRFYSGVRAHESNRRMQNVDGARREAERWVWISPIHDWRDSAVDAYREEHDLPTNPVAEKIGRSGDCFCGAFSNRTADFVELEAHYPGHAEWIKELEKDVQEELGTDEKYCYWGFGNMSENELRSMMAQNDDAQMHLCSSCDMPDTGDFDWSND